MLERMSPLLSRPVLRGVVIAVVTLFVASAIFTPQLNPFTRSAFLAAMNVGPVWGEVTQWRAAMIDARNDLGDWPPDIQKYAPPIANPKLRVTSPRPNVLQGDIAHNPELGKIAGTQVIMEFHPDSFTWSCRRGNPPVPQGYLPINCDDGVTDDREPSKPSAASDPFGWLRSLIIGCAVIFCAGAVVWVVRHPLIGSGQLRPARLRRTPLKRLPKIDRLLRWMGRLDATLQAAEVRTADWRRAVLCAQANGLDYATGLAQALADKVVARQQTSADWALPGVVLEWQFAPDLPVSLDRCLVLVPTPGLDEAALVQSLRAAQTGSDVLLVLSEHSVEAPMPLLRSHCEDSANLHVMVDSASLTEWLLGGQALQVLLRLLSTQLRITRISPYQTRGGVTREGSFFGRAQLLARVVTREPANYLVVGGASWAKAACSRPCSAACRATRTPCATTYRCATTDWPRAWHCNWACLPTPRSKTSWPTCRRRRWASGWCCSSTRPTSSSALNQTKATPSCPHCARSVKRGAAGSCWQGSGTCMPRPCWITKAPCATLARC